MRCERHSAPPSAASSSASGKTKAPPRRVEVEDLGIAAPGHSGLNLALRLLIAELLVEHVEEEFFGHGMVALGVYGATDLAQQEDITKRRVTEKFFLAENFGVRKLAFLFL